MLRVITAKDEGADTEARGNHHLETAMVPSSLLKELGSNIGALGRVIESLSGGVVSLEPEESNSFRHSQSATIADLKPRSLEVLALMSQGYSNCAIASKLALQPKTVENHINYIYQALNLGHGDQHHSRVLAVLDFIDYTSGARKADS